MEKMAWGGPKWVREDFLPTNLDLADILGRTDLDFENFDFLFFGPQISGFPGPQISKIWPGPGLHAMKLLTVDAKCGLHATS